MFGKKVVRTLLDGELSKTSEFGRTLDKHLLKLAPLVQTLFGVQGANTGGVRLTNPGLRSRRRCSVTAFVASLTVGGTGPRPAN